MAISKRTRYEILKRDNFTCRYCGAKAPDVKLHIDHVMPQSLGGTDDATNLVTACMECNSGKTSTRPSDSLIAQISDTEIALQAAYAKVVAERTAQVEKYQKAVQSVLRYWKKVEIYSDPPSDAKATIRRFLGLGLTVEEIKESFDIAEENISVPHRAKWKYSCGVLHNKARKIENDALALVRKETREKYNQCGHCEYCRDPEDDSGECLLYAPPEDEKPLTCPYCDDPDCLYGVGYSDGMDIGGEETYMAFYDQIVHYRTCPEVNHVS